MTKSYNPAIRKKMSYRNTLRTLSHICSTSETGLGPLRSCLDRTETVRTIVKRTRIIQGIGVLSMLDVMSKCKRLTSHAHATNGTDDHAPTPTHNLAGTNNNAASPTHDPASAPAGASRPSRAASVGSVEDVTANYTSPVGQNLFPVCTPSVRNVTSLLKSTVTPLHHTSSNTAPIGTRSASSNRVNPDYSYGNVARTNPTIATQDNIAPRLNTAIANPYTVNDSEIFGSVSGYEWNQYFRLISALPVAGRGETRVLNAEDWQSHLNHRAQWRRCKRSMMPRCQCKNRYMSRP